MAGLKHILLFLFVLGGTVACKQQETVQEEYLFGKWNIQKAQRNGRETPYLRGGYFVIGKDGKITVNIDGSDEAGSYTLDNNVIKTSNEKEFVLQSVRPDSMIIKYMAPPAK